MSATPAEKNALFSVAGSIFMLIFAIAFSANLILKFASNIVALDISAILTGIFSGLFDALTVAGLWVLYVSARKKKLTTAGVTLIKVPLVITFIFGLIGGIFGLIGNVITLNVIGLIINLFKFIFYIMYFASIKNLLNLGRTIESDRSVMGRKAGMFAAIITIIFAVINLAGGIWDKLFGNALVIILELLGIGGGFTEVALGLGISAVVVEFLISVYAAVLIIIFNKKLG